MYYSFGLGEVKAEMYAWGYVIFVTIGGMSSVETFYTVSLYQQVKVVCIK